MQSGDSTKARLKAMNELTGRKLLINSSSANLGRSFYGGYGLMMGETCHVVDFHSALKTNEGAGSCNSHVTGCVDRGG